MGVCPTDLHWYVLKGKRLTTYCLRYIWCGDTFTTRAFNTLEEAEAFIEHGLRLYPHAFDPTWLDERTYVHNEDGDTMMVRFLLEEFIDA